MNGMCMRRIWAVVLACLSLTSYAQDSNYPVKPIKLLVGYAPGGATDIVARSIAIKMQETLGQPIIVENRAGASSNIASEFVARSAPDGYTLLLGTIANATNMTAYKNMGYDTMRDFVHITQFMTAPSVLTLHPSVPANNLKEFIAWAKQNPGKLNYASQGNGSVSHIGTEIFKQQTGIEMTHVPYKGSGQAIQDVLAGQVQVFITTPPSVMGHVQSGKLKALAVTGKIRHPQLPQVPTASEAGLSGFELESWVALYVASGTPKDVVQKLSADVKRSMELPETKQRADAAGVEVRYLTPENTTKLLDRDTVSWAKAIKAGNIKFD